MSAPSLATEAAASTGFPTKRFNQRERQILSSVKDYVDAISPSTTITTQGDIIIGDSSGDAARLAKGTSGLPLVAGASTVSYAALAAGGLASDSVTTAKILAANVTLAKLAAGITPSHVVKFAASQVATAGGSATEAKTVTGVLSTDVVHVTLSVKGGTPRTILTAIPSADTITIVFSGDPSTDHKYDYSVMRAAA